MFQVVVELALNYQTVFNGVQRKYRKLSALHKLNTPSGGHSQLAALEAYEHVFDKVWVFLGDFILWSLLLYRAKRAVHQISHLKFLN
jgi:hypothetical protein